MSDLEALARSIASEIVNQAIWENYKFYLLVAAISLVSSGFVAFSGSYFKKKGENLATKADFNEILRQLKETTSLTEGIKTDIKAKLDEQQNVRALLRQKLESLIEQTFDLELWFDKARSQAMNGDLPDLNGGPMAKIEMYQAIYFKEVQTELFTLKKAVHPFREWLLSLTMEALDAKYEKRAANFQMDKFGDLYKDFLTAVNGLRESLIKIYASKVGL